jgi:hypothetical protein
MRTYNIGIVAQAVGKPEILSVFNKFDVLYIELEKKRLESLGYTIYTIQTYKPIGIYEKD